MGSAKEESLVGSSSTEFRRHSLGCNTAWTYHKVGQEHKASKNLAINTTIFFFLV